MSDALRSKNLPTSYAAEAGVGGGLLPVFEGLMRGALAFGILGIGFGGIAAGTLHVPFDGTFQWASAGAGAALGVIVGVRWGRHHRL